jgi:hypothetical protein
MDLMDHGTMNHPAKNESAASTELLYDKKETIRDTIRVVLWDLGNFCAEKF